MGEAMRKHSHWVKNSRQATLWDREEAEQKDDLDRSNRRNDEGCSETVIQASNGLEIEVRNSCTELELQKLTKTQCIVLALYRTKGGPTKIAKALGISVGRVEEQLTRIRNRLGKTHCRQLLDGYREQLSVDPNAITQAQLLRLLEKQEYRCALTGVELSPETSALDHKTPRASGGTNTIENVWFVLDKVNKMKGTLEIDEFIKLCKLVAENCSFSGPS